MRILILGGTRYFGRRLLEKCVAEGHEVSIASSGRTPLASPVEHLLINRNDVLSIAAAFSGRDWDLAYDQIGFNAQNSRDLASTLQVPRLIFTSSQSVYDLGLQLSEDDFVAEIYEENPANLNAYQEGKRLAEKEYTTQLEFSVCSVRFPIVLGPDDYSRRLAWHVSRVRDGLPIYFPNLNSQIGFISSSDAAGFLSWLKDFDFSGSINAASPDSISLRELIELIEITVGKKCVLASSASSDNHSPFGIESDWTMNVSKAERMGFVFSPLRSWLPDLIGELVI